MKKYKFIIIIIVSLFIVFVFYEVNRSSKIPEHIHSIDDKSADQRTDEENLTILERSLGKEPKNINILMQIADLYIKMNKIDEAEKYLKQIIDINPDNTVAINKLKKK